MNKILLVACFILVVGCKSDQEPVEENLSDLNLYLSTDEDIDSVLITDIYRNRENHKVAFNDTLRFKFKDSINDLYNIQFIKDGKIVSSPMGHFQIWLKGEKIQLKGTIDKKLIIDTIIGSQVHYAREEYNRESRKIYKDGASLEVKNELTLRTIKSNMDNPFSLAVADIYYGLNQNNPENLYVLYEIMSKQDKTIRDHEFFRVWERVNSSLNNIPIDFEKYSFRDIENKPVKINLKTGKKYLIDAWFVNCPPCIEDHKTFSKELKLFDSAGIDVIGLSVDQKHEVWNEYLEKNGYNWTNYRVDENETMEEINKDLRLGSFPNYMLLNTERKIEFSTNSYEEIKEYLEINS
ncbi:hypothetical protein AAU57_03490 [Nonlabens sp. YIK11]|uniref:TlpA family protein disulfide reductase n=1 Tax=Nonlabens sp. YIK11 TaxID=1453349 RepID=UPI0006DC5D61|nr:thioredoxin-like domain-containing protein [Nonlabens sp. YIK11]KQC32500.1 hypothetical protein AAU57_03490 [Nonlabens sp. YIK11]